METGMKIRQAQTAIDVWHSKTDKELNRENKHILAVIEKLRTATISQIVRANDWEKSTVSRILNTLLFKKQLIRIINIAPCPVTGKTVRHYCVVKPASKQLEIELN